MLTIAFVVLKISDTLLLSWWWVILALVIDIYESDANKNKILFSYEEGLKEGKEAYMEKREPEELQ